MKGILSIFLLLFAFWATGEPWAVDAKEVGNRVERSTGTPNENGAGAQVVEVDRIGPSASVDDRSETWTRPALFFECEEDLREFVSRKKHGGLDRKFVPGFAPRAASIPVYSVHVPSAVVGRGRNFHPTPHVSVACGVFRV